MAILDIFKKKRKKEGEGVKKEEIKEPAEVKIKEKQKSIERTPEKKEEIRAEIPKSKGKTSDTAWRILKAPHITEKATDLTKKNQYVFKVFPRVNKAEIKKAIEGLYGIDVVSVKIIKVPRKQRRVGKHLGWRKGYKKAIVKIKGGQKIEVLSR